MMTFTEKSSVNVHKEKVFIVESKTIRLINVNNTSISVCCSLQNNLVFSAFGSIVGVSGLMLCQ